MIFGEQATQFLAIITTFFGVAMSLSYIPQIHRIIKRKSSEDISLIFLAIIALGLIFWFLYGLALGNWPLIIVNGLGLITTQAVLIIAWRYRKK